VNRHQLECFVAVADAGSFTRAAAQLRIAQPSLSQAIAGLERDLGTSVFHRIGRGVQLSATGEALLEPARRVIRDFAVAQESVDTVKGLAAGRLDVAVIPTLVIDPFARLVGAFCERYPAVSVRSPDLEVAGSVDAAVASGACEIGVTELPSAQTGLVEVALGTQPFQLVLPPGTRAPKRYPLRRLGELALIATPPGTSSRARLDEALEVGGVLAARIAVETGQREALTGLVLAGAGAAFLPEPMAAQAARLGATVAATLPVVTRRFGLIHRAGPLSPAASAFLAIARDGARSVTGH
jgi:DNA-binding transcriptional LysR family regulator